MSFQTEQVGEVLARSMGIPWTQVAELAISHRYSGHDVVSAGPPRTHSRRCFRWRLGLNPGSLAVCHQITTLDRAKLHTRVGRLTQEEILGVEEEFAACDLRPDEKS